MPFEKLGMPQIIGINEGDEWTGGSIQPFQHRRHLATIDSSQNGAKALVPERLKDLLDALITSIGGPVVEHNAFEIFVALRRN